MPKKIGAMSQQLGPIFENGVLVKLKNLTPESSVDVTTAPNGTVRIFEVPIPRPPGPNFELFGP